MGFRDLFTSGNNSDVAVADGYSYAEDDPDTIDDADAEREVISEAAAEEMYRDMLDESGPVMIGELRYDVSRVLEAVDEVAYRVGLSDYISSLVEDGYDVEGYE